MLLNLDPYLQVRQSTRGRYSQGNQSAIDKQGSVGKNELCFKRRVEWTEPEGSNPSKFPKGEP